MLVELLKALADETRIRIINLLRIEPLCVCDLEEILKITQSNASRHATKLKSAGVITGEKQAQWVYYRISESALARHSFLKELLSDLDNNKQCQTDLARLRKYKERGGSCECAIKLDD